jgi:hypothetical protein
MICEYNHPHNPEGPCEGEVKVRSSMTQYVFDGVKNSPEDPNRDFQACEYHYQCYREYWNEMWNDYYSMIRGGIF